MVACQMETAQLSTSVPDSMLAQWVLARSDTLCRVFHKPLLIHVLSEGWGVGMHFYLRTLGFKHAAMAVSRPFCTLSFWSAAQ